MLNYWSGEKSLRQGYIGTIALTIIITQCVSVHNEICVSLLISFHRFYVKFTQFTHVAVCLCESITLLSGNCWPQSAVVHHNWVSIVWFRLQWDQQKWDTVSTYEYDCWPEAGTCDQNSHCDVIRWDKSSKESQLERITVNHSLWCVLSAFYCLFKSVWLMKAHLLLSLHCTFFPFVCLIWHIHTHSYAYSCTQTYIYTHTHTFSILHIHVCYKHRHIYIIKKNRSHFRLQTWREKKHSVKKYKNSSCYGCRYSCSCPESTDARRVFFPDQLWHQNTRSDKEHRSVVPPSWEIPRSTCMQNRQMSEKSEMQKLLWIQRLSLSVCVCFSLSCSLPPSRLYLAATAYCFVFKGKPHHLKQMGAGGAPLCTCSVRGDRRTSASGCCWLPSEHLAIRVSAQWIPTLHLKVRQKEPERWSDRSPFSFHRDGTLRTLLGHFGWSDPSKPILNRFKPRFNTRNSLTIIPHLVPSPQSIFRGSWPWMGTTTRRLQRRWICAPRTGTCPRLRMVWGREEVHPEVHRGRTTRTRRGNDLRTDAPPSCPSGNARSKSRRTPRASRRKTERTARLRRMRQTWQLGRESPVQPRSARYRGLWDEMWGTQDRLQVDIPCPFCTITVSVYVLSISLWHLCYLVSHFINQTLLIPPMEIIKYTG